MRRDLTAYEALDKFIDLVDESAVILDVGSGAGEHAKEMRAYGLEVATNSLEPPADYLGDFMDLDPDLQFDAIWAAHVLEHQPNPNAFLKKCFNHLPEGGLLAVTVPPLKHDIVGGHVSLWNGGILLYQAILAGFDCSEARLKRYAYNISLIVEKKSFDMPKLRMDTGDIETLAPYFPMKVKQGFNGDIKEVNWR